jgi:hypothetical protein
MTVKDYLDTFIQESETILEYPTLLKYINIVESNVCTGKEYRNKYYAGTLNAFQLSLPDGVDFDDVRKLYINGHKYKKKDVRANKEYQTYWYEDGKLCHYPACTETDKSYVSGEITFASSTITTTGDDFAFSIGDVILVSGATTSANNKSATIIGVADKTLTFASGTFTAEADAAAVTITAPKIKLTYEYKPETKLIANIATDTLLLPDKFIQAYDFFLMSKIAYLQKEYGEYNNHQVSYNAEVARYQEWYENNRPLKPDDEMASDDYAEETDFDRS